MTASHYTVSFEFRDGDCDPRLHTYEWDFLRQTDATFSFTSNVVPTASETRSLFAFQWPQNRGRPLLEQEKGKDFRGVNSENIEQLVYLNTMRRLVVAILDDPSLDEKEKADIFGLLKGKDGINVPYFKHFMNKVDIKETTHREKVRDELYVQDLCRAFVLDRIVYGNAYQTNLHCIVAQKFCETIPLLVRDKTAPMLTIEVADANTWLLTAYYPKDQPQHHRMFLCVPLELESPTGLRCRVTIDVTGSRSVQFIDTESRRV